MMVQETTGCQSPLMLSARIPHNVRTGFRPSTAAGHSQLHSGHHFALPTAIPDH